MQPQRIACKGWTPLLYLCHYAQSTSQPCKTLKQSRAQLALTRPNSTPGARSDASMHILTPARRRALINQQELVGGLIEGGGLSIVIISGLDLIGIESTLPRDFDNGRAEPKSGGTEWIMMDRAVLAMGYEAWIRAR